MFIRSVSMPALLIVSLLALSVPAVWAQSAAQGTRSVTQKSEAIRPNLNKVYSDQCYVWLKEMPHFFRQRHYLPDGLAWDRHSYQGIYVSNNPKSLFYSRHYVALGLARRLGKAVDSDRLRRRDRPGVHL